MVDLFTLPYSFENGIQILFHICQKLGMALKLSVHCLVSRVRNGVKGTQHFISLLKPLQPIIETSDMLNSHVFAFRL